MATVPAEVIRRGARRLVPLFLVALCMLPGCVLLDKTVSKHKEPTGPCPTRVVVAWEPKVHYAADPTRGGAMNPGLAGRLYLFGEDVSFPLVCEGKVHVELFDVTPRENGVVAPRALETWDFDPATLQKLLRRDMFGQGYTLFLPWGTFRPDITRVQLRTTFTPSAGPAPLFGSPSTLNLANPLVFGGANPHGPIGPNIEMRTNKPVTPPGVPAPPK